MPLQVTCITAANHHFLLSAGYPLISYFTKTTQSTFGGFNLGGINATGQVNLTFINH